MRAGFVFVAAALFAPCAPFAQALAQDGAGVPQDWTIELVARSSVNSAIPAFRLPQGSSLSSQPVSIDELGGVAFRAVLSGNPSEGIFYGDPDAGGLIVTGNSADSLFSSSVDAFGGRVAVADSFFSGNDLNVYDTSGVLVAAYPPGGTLGTSGPSSPTLSADGAVCYEADFGFVGDRLVVDEFIAGARVQTAEADDFSGVYDFLLTPRMNASRQIAINTIPSSGPSRRIVRFAPGAMGYEAVTLAETGPVYQSFVNSTGIGSDGAIAFTGQRNDTSREVVLAGADGSLTVIAEGGQSGISNTNLANFPPVNNANGLAAFRVEDGSGSTAIYVGDGTDLVRIVGAGDLLETDLGPIAAGFNFGGLTGVQTINSNIDINDDNQIAFGAFLENGTIGIFIATPTNAACSGADLATPFGTLDIFDVIAFLALFDGEDPGADLAAPAGVFDIFDVIEYLAVFDAGC